MRSLALVCLFAIAVFLSACQSGAQPQPAACNCAKTNAACTCAHCKDAKAGKASPAACECGKKDPKKGGS